MGIVGRDKKITAARHWAGECESRAFVLGSLGAQFFLQIRLAEEDV